MRLGRCTVGLVLACAIISAGCDAQRTPHPDPQRAFSELDHAGADEVVARVGQRTVSVGEFESYWRDHPELGRSEVLDALIERELWVAEALRRDQVPEKMADVRKRALVRQMLREQVEQEVSAEDLDEAQIAAAIESVQKRAGHPPGLRASHLLVRVPKEIDDEKLSDAKRERLFEEARAALDDVTDALPDELTALDLFEARKAHLDGLDEPLELYVNAHLVFPFDDEDFAGELPESWAPVVPAFRAAAVELAKRGRFGERSEPVRSQFGWHVLVVEAQLPASRPDSEALREVAVSEALRRKRAERFSEVVEKWRQDADIRSYPEVISQAETLQE